MRFRTTILMTGKNTAGLEIPADVVEGLGAGKRPPVTGIAGGDVVDVDLELDTAPREITVPPDLNAALDAETAARKTFDGLSYSNKSWHTLQVEGARTDETRQRRIARSIEILRAGRPR